jgi:dTDP-glucose pyrophosphorylase
VEVQSVYICGGNGTRLAGRQAGLPKSLVPVGGEPLIARLVNAFARQSDLPFTVREPTIFVHAASDPHIPAWVRAHVPKARLAAQEAPDGVANAVLAALPFLDGPALVVLGDLVVVLGALEGPAPVPPAVAIWPEGPAEATRRNFGVAIGEGGEVNALVEKPRDPRGLVCGLGVYLLGRDDIAALAGAPIDPVSGERQITSALEHLRAQRGRLGTLRFRGRYVNVNSAADLAEAERALGVAP